ncbi:hypothetical protein AVEN_81790-1 [Araneus ventricosus]|uniref:Uncharacterized protein n=1 Tax=Araneus ventricosus TaxID=182803 RepID=A0A4Y2LAL2_ARAVE|nr:hypothetical protein AVEN_81790-1 [Araneus ventricosus]
MEDISLGDFGVGDVYVLWRTGQVASLPDGKWAPLDISQYGPSGCELTSTATALSGDVDLRGIIPQNLKEIIIGHIEMNASPLFRAHAAQKIREETIFIGLFLYNLLPVEPVTSSLSRPEAEFLRPHSKTGDRKKGWRREGIARRS